MTSANSKFWPIVPTPWVREGRRDKWKPRQRVVRYRAFRDECVLRKVWPPRPGDLVIFLLPMPKSWSETSRAMHDGHRHLQTPDVDNLLKALLDAVYHDDAHIWAITAVKVWSVRPGIYISRRADPPIEMPFRPFEELAPC